MNLLEFSPPFLIGLPLLMSLPLTLGYVVLGVLILGLVGASGFVLARLGIKPLWALLIVVPGAQLVVPWVLAYMRWPRAAANTNGKPDGPPEKA